MSDFKTVDIFPSQHFCSYELHITCIMLICGNLSYMAIRSSLFIFVTLTIDIKFSLISWWQLPLLLGMHLFLHSMNLRI